MDCLEGLEVGEAEEAPAIIAKLAKAKERLAILSKAKGGIVVPKEKKVPKFNGTGDFTQWKEDMESVLNRFTNPTDKTSFIFDHLEGPARTEIKFHCDVRKAAPAEILELLTNIYSSHDNVIQLQQAFSGRKQLEGESLMQYSTALLECFLEWREKDPSKALPTQQEQIMKSQFAEGVSDTNLKRELHRLNTERGTLKFHELRTNAIEYLETGKMSAASCQITANTDLQQLSQLVQQQQQQINQLLSGKEVHINQHQQTPQDSQKEEVLCNHCGEKNHFKRDCIQYKRQFQSRGRGEPRFSYRNQMWEPRHYEPRHWVPRGRGQYNRGQMDRGRGYGRGRGYNPSFHTHFNHRQHHPPRFPHPPYNSHHYQQYSYQQDPMMFEEYYPEYSQSEANPPADSLNYPEGVGN